MRRMWINGISNSSLLSDFNTTKYCSVFIKCLKQKLHTKQTPICTLQHMRALLLLCLQKCEQLTIWHIKCHSIYFPLYQCDTKRAIIFQVLGNFNKVYSCALFRWNYTFTDVTKALVSKKKTRSKKHFVEQISKCHFFPELMGNRNGFTVLLRLLYRMIHFFPMLNWLILTYSDCSVIHLNYIIVLYYFYSPPHRHYNGVLVLNK